MRRSLFSNLSKRNRKFLNFLIYIFLIINSFIVMYPFLFMVMNSFKTGPEIMHNPNALPKNISFNGYIGVFKELNILRLFWNTIFISGTTTILNTLFSAMVAYGIVKSNLPIAKTLKKIILASMMIPGILLLIPTYMMMYDWNWINTYKVMIIPASISAYNVFLIMQFMKQIDNSYLEAARIDGASELQVFFKVVFPMCLPVLATVSILTFMGSWNDFFGALLYLRDEKHMTLQLALYRFSGSIPGQYLEQLWAATTIITLPVVVVYIFLQKYFIKAFTGIGLK